MPDVSYDLQPIENLPRSAFGIGDQEAWSRVSCERCESPQMVVVLRSLEKGQFWLRCPSCFAPAVMINGEMFPRASGLRNPVGQPEADQYVWEEIRSCMSAGAYNAVVMLCRKLLFHLAVSHGLPEKNSKDRAPTFVEAVNHLASEGLVTAPMRPWVDRIKNVGNEANHEIPRINPAQAQTVAKFTEQMLLMTYEYPVELAESAPLPDLK